MRYFKIRDRNAGGNPTPPPGSAGCSDGLASVNITVLPNNCDRGGTVFLFIGHGFQPGENVGVYVTDPTQAVYGAPFQVEAASDGSAGPVSFTTSSNFPTGIWAMTMEGTSSHTRAIG